MLKISLQRIAISSASIWLLLALSMTAKSQDQAASQIAAKYKDKLVTLHSSYCGKELHFDADAKLVSRPTWGYWKTCQGMRIRNLQIEDDKIKIDAQRVPISYDCATKRVRDLSLERPEKNKKAQYDQISTEDQNVSIEMQLGSNSDEKSVLELMDKLFRQSDPVLGPDGEIRSAGLGTSAPVMVHTPDPAYSEEARAAGYEGTVVLSVVVGVDGLVHNARVVQALGKGLDKKAIEALKKWRFKPGTMCGSPVPVQVDVEITFKLD